MVVVEFFPIDLKYKIVNNRTHTYIFGKTFDGKRVCVIDRETLPYFYVIPKDVIFANKIVDKIKTYNDPEGKFELLSSKLVDTKYLGKNITAIKIFVNRPFALKFFDSEIKKDNLLKEYVGAVLETDILYTRRYLLDKKIVPFELIAVTGEIVPQNFRVATLLAEKFEVGGDSLDGLNGLAFNISQEADGSIISIAYCDKFSSKVITWKKNPSTLSNIEFVDGEAELILKFKQILDEHKPDVLVGYNSSQKMINITRRAEKYHLRFDINLDRSTPSENNGTTAGIVHIDLRRLLNTFSKKLFGSSLSPETGKLMALVDKLTGNSEFSTLDKELYDQFFRNSTECSSHIFKLFQEITPYAMELSKQVGHTLKSIQFMGQESLIESYLIRHAIANDELIPKKPSDIVAISRKREIFINDYVYENNSLMEDDFLEFDFSSIYPAVIISKNISFETSDCECCTTPFCSNKKGFFLSYQGKTIKDGEYLGFTFKTADIKKFTKNFRKKATTKVIFLRWLFKF